MRWNKAMSIAAAVVGSILILWSGKSEQPPSGWEPMLLGANQPTSEQSPSVTQSAASVRENVDVEASGRNGSERKSDTVTPVDSSMVKASNVAVATQAELSTQQQAQIEESRSPVIEKTSNTAGESIDGVADHGKIDVNTASVSKLTELPGIGQKKAQAIVDYRNAHGPFLKVSDLTKVKGIGMKMLEKMAAYVQIR